MSHGKIIHTWFHEEAVCIKGYKFKKKKKKACITSVGNTAMWLYHSLAGSETISPLLKEQRQK